MATRTKKQIAILTEEACEKIKQVIKVAVLFNNKPYFDSDLFFKSGLDEIITHYADKYQIDEEHIRTILGKICKSRRAC